jgi:hypothetical protein
MILFPLTPKDTEVSTHKDAIPVWDAILEKQTTDAAAWWLITQPDHAALAGDLAAAIRSPHVPSLDDEVIQAISLHDAGWAALDGGGDRGGGEVTPIPPHISHARPASFLEIPIRLYLPVWAASIAKAESISPIGGFIVSEHFCRIGEMALNLKPCCDADTTHLRDFLNRESERKARLTKVDCHSALERNLLVDVLQFCDLLSLYLCCGARETVEFPQRFNGQVIRLTCIGDVFQIEPSMFGSGVSLGVSARRYPPLPELPSVSIPFLLA